VRELDQRQHTSEGPNAEARPQQPVAVGVGV